MKIDRYCDICEKEVETAWIIIEHGNRYAHGVCGHNTLIKETPKGECPTFVMNMAGTHNNEYGKYGRK